METLELRKQILNELETIESKVTEIEETKLRPLNERKHELNTKLCEIDFGVKLFEYIEYEGNKYKVTEFCNNMWPVGFLFKKNGEFSKKKTNLYNFKKVR